MVQLSLAGLFWSEPMHVWPLGQEPSLAHADQMLEVLAAVTACGEQPFESLEHLVLNHVKVVSGCVGPSRSIWLP